MPSIKGTASISSTHALSKLLRTTNFPSHFSTKVDISKIHRGVLSHWINQRITEILGFEDEIVSEMATNLFLPEETEGSTNNNTVEIDPRKAQLDLVGFLGEKESAEFANELWEMMIDGSQRKSGIPLVLVQKKKEEMARAREEQRFGGQRGIERQEPARRYAGGPQGGEMNAFVREAARRAEMARAALRNNNISGNDVQAVPPSPKQESELYRIDRSGDRDDRGDGGSNERGGGELDEFGRRREDYKSTDRKHEPSSRRNRSPSRSRSRSRSTSSQSYGSVSPHQRHKDRDDRRKRSRSNSSEDNRRRRRDRKDTRR